MADSRITTWTRRRFGAAAAALAALGGLRTEEAGAKRCGQNEKKCGKKCVKGTCCPGKKCGEACRCRKGRDGRAYCLNNRVLTLCEQCNSNAECDPGFKCIKVDGCPNDVTAACQPLCDTDL